MIANDRGERGLTKRAEEEKERGKRRREVTNIYPWEEKFEKLDAVVRASTSE